MIPQNYALLFQTSECVDVRIRLLIASRCMPLYLCRLNLGLWVHLKNYQLRETIRYGEEEEKTPIGHNLRINIGDVGAWYSTWRILRTGRRALRSERSTSLKVPCNSKKAILLPCLRPSFHLLANFIK